MSLLEVNELKTQFFTRDGVVRAVDGVTFHLDQGETLGLVGESGCGKSVTALSLMRLIPQPPGKIVNGSVMFDGQDILKMDDDDVRGIRGNNIAMIFQDPMTSLNPVLTISRQISEALELHMKMSKGEARTRTVELLELVGIPNAMLAEAVLSFYGIGIKPPTPSWGVMINEGFTVFSTTAWPVLLPAVCISIVMLAFTFLGDGLRDALDPRMKL